MILEKEKIFYELQVLQQLSKQQQNNLLLICIRINNFGFRKGKKNFFRGGAEVTIARTFYFNSEIRNVKYFESIISKFSFKKYWGKFLSYNSNKKVSPGNSKLI